MVGLGFVGNGELKNDAVDGGIGITMLDSGGKLGGGDEKVVNCHADVGAVMDFESDVFVDDWRIIVANNGENWGFAEARYLVSLALFDKIRKLLAV